MNLYLSSIYYDGTSPKPHAVDLSVAQGHLWIRGADWQKSYALNRIRWPERRTHGTRVCELPDGGLIEHSDGAQWDAWCQTFNRRPESPVVQWMQSWRATSIFFLATIAVCVASWLWGIPLLSQIVVDLVPPKLEQHFGQQALTQLERTWLKPSTLAPEKQKDITQQFHAMLQRAYPGMPQANVTPPLRFYASKELKANALALPGGVIVMTDDLVGLLEDDPNVLMGVLAHEWGHARHRHSLHKVVQASLVSALVGVVLGDISNFLATVPSTLLVQAYAREDERQADAQAAWFLHRNGVAPSEMVRLFDKLQAQKDEASDKEPNALPIALSSHPMAEERKAFFRNWRASAVAE